MAEGLTGPGCVGRYFDHERINQGQMDGAFVRAESVLGGLAGLFGPWIPGLRWAGLAARLTPYPGGENGGPADNAQPPSHRPARDDRLRLAVSTGPVTAALGALTELGKGPRGLRRFDPDILPEVFDRTDLTPRELASDYKKAFAARLTDAAREAGATNPGRLGEQLALLLDGASARSRVLNTDTFATAIPAAPAPAAASLRT